MAARIREAPAERVLHADPAAWLRRRRPKSPPLAAETKLMSGEIAHAISPNELREDVAEPSAQRERHARGASPLRVRNGRVTPGSRAARRGGPARSAAQPRHFGATLSTSARVPLPWDGRSRGVK